MSVKLCDEKVFFEDLEFSNKNELFEFIADELVKLERVEKPERILQKFHEKEREVTTFLGSKFAIPHLKSTKVLENTIVFIRLKKSLVWNNEEDKVRYICAVLVKPRHDDLYIDILMSLSRNIIDAKKVDILKHSNDRKEVLELLNHIY
ncbi:PTS sugar transporter subunit IIA [Streptobacillus felis]|uniref:PTS sugar transporter subunit IIA n=1 Tax=Streptobacillus felis TaxID=1384509 RepID=A0A7Z0PF06_9FUSO|nr:PTS sugar transporter subunit IIA [Streptobacillus felis]NYV28059.1 PTS sugar transporter subunit IIA [Streptobacillus felis]